MQVVMPTVKDDVAFGLSRFNLTLEEIRSRVEKSLDAVGMYDYLQVSVKAWFLYIISIKFLAVLTLGTSFYLYLSETSPNS